MAYEPLEDQMLPSNSSSDVSRQYAGRLARTVNASVSDWSTSRLRMSTSGLTVTRDWSPGVRCRHASIAFAPAPGTCGPTARPTPTARTPSSAPAPSNHRRPLGALPLTHRRPSSWRAVRWQRTKRSTAPMNSAVVHARWSGAPSSAPNMNSTEAGATDSAVAQMRKADQSENHTAPQMASAAASWNPGRIGAGASTLLNRFMAWSNAASAAWSVSSWSGARR